jgi:hypothetical protein
MPRMSAPTVTNESTPPRLSTGSVVSFTCAGTTYHASRRAATATGTVTRNTEPHQNSRSRSPDSSGPIEAKAAPSADHSAIARVRPGPPQSAVIKARVVG